MKTTIIYSTNHLHINLLRRIQLDVYCLLNSDLTSMNRNEVYITGTFLKLEFFGIKFS